MIKDKEKRFCDLYLVDFDRKKAAIECGYSEKRASVVACEILAKPEVQDYIKEAQSELAERIGITQKMVLDELAKIGFSNIKDYMDGHLCMKNLNEVDENKSAAIGSIKKTVTTFEGGETVYTEFKLHDKIKSLELIGKHLGFFEKDNKKEVITKSADLSEDDIKKLAKGLDEKY